MCGASNVTLIGSEVRSDFDDNVCDINPGTDVAHLTLHQYGDYVDIPPYLEKRPSALHPLPDAPRATVFTLRKEFVHSTQYSRASRRQEVLLCETCYMVVNLKPVPVLRPTAISNP